MEQSLREDLDRSKNFKLEVATYFGKPRTFFDCLATPGGEGHARVYQFIKRLYSQMENLRVTKVTAGVSSSKSPATAGRTESPNLTNM